MPNPPIVLVPNSGQSLDATRDSIRINFTTLNNVFAVDHEAYGSPNEGNHKKVTLQVQSPAPAFVAGTVNLYNALYAGSGRNELFIRSDGTSPAVPISARPNGTATGYAFLPSGLLIQWSQTQNAPANATTLIMFPLAYKNPGGGLFLELSQNALTRTVTSGGFNGTFTGFNVINGTGNAQSFSYFAIGIGA